MEAQFKLGFSDTKDKTFSQLGEKYEIKKAKFDVTSQNYEVSPQYYIRSEKK